MFAGWTHPRWGPCPGAENASKKYPTRALPDWRHPVLSRLLVAIAVSRSSAIAIQPLFKARFCEAREDANNRRPSAQSLSLPSPQRPLISGLSCFGSPESPFNSAPELLSITAPNPKFCRLFSAREKGRPPPRTLPGMPRDFSCHPSLNLKDIFNAKSNSAAITFEICTT